MTHPLSVQRIRQRLVFGASCLTLLGAGLFLSGCPEQAQKRQIQALEARVGTPKPGGKLELPDDYTGPIDPMWPPSHPANLDDELKAAAVIKARMDKGEPIDLTINIPEFKGSHDEVYATRGKLGEVEYLEVILGKVRHPYVELPLVVIFHGRGGKPSIPQSPLGQDAPVRLFLPQGPDKLGDGYQWLAAQTKSGKKELLGRSIAARADELAPIIQAFSELRPTRGKPVLIGFSQGAILSYGLYARHPKRFGAVFPIAGWLPDELMPLKPERSSFPELRAFHGTNDNIVPVAKDRKTVKDLKLLGLGASLTEYKNTGHIVSSEMTSAVRSQLKGLLYPALFPADKRRLKTKSP